MKVCPKVSKLRRNFDLTWMSDTLMLYQRERERKRPVTERAAVRSLLRMMCNVMFLKVYCLTEMFSTLGAMVGLLSGVNAQMDTKLRLFEKSLSTLNALVWFIFIVDLLLSCKILLLNRERCFHT